MKKGQQIPEIKDLADFLLSRKHISITAIEKEINMYQGQLHKAITGKLRRPLSPFLRASLTEALKPYGFTTKKKLLDLSPEEWEELKLPRSGEEKKECDCPITARVNDKCSICGNEF